MRMKTRTIHYPIHDLNSTESIAFECSCASQFDYNIVLRPTHFLTVCYNIDFFFLLCHIHNSQLNINGRYYSLEYMVEISVK